MTPTHLAIFFFSGAGRHAKRKYILPNGMVMWATPREIEGFLGYPVASEIPGSDPRSSRPAERIQVRKQPNQPLIVHAVNDDDAIMAIVHLI